MSAVITRRRCVSIVLRGMVMAIFMMFAAQSYSAPPVAHAAEIIHVDEAAAPSDPTFLYTRGTHAPEGVPQAIVPANAKAVGQTEYPAEFGWPLGDDVSYLDSSQMGVEDNLATIKNTPGKVTLSGHSQGATVAGDTVEAALQQGVKTDDELSFDLYSDPRLTGTGAEVVLAKYSPLLAPLVGGELRGERDFGDVQGESHCNVGDFVCNAEDPLMNPGGAICGIVGYATGYHGDYGNKTPSRSVQRGNTLVHIYDGVHPCTKMSEDIIGGPVTPEFDKFVNAVAPFSEPGSPELSSPDFGEVAVTAVNAAAAGLNIPARVPDLPEVSDLGFDQSYVDNGLAQVEEFANNAAPQFANVVEQAAPIIEQAVEQFTQNAPAQNYTAPVANYDAPAAPAQQITDLATQVAPAAAPVINDAVNALGALGIRF